MSSTKFDSRGQQDVLTKIVSGKIMPSQFSNTLSRKFFYQEYRQRQEPCLYILNKKTGIFDSI